MSVKRILHYGIQRSGTNFLKEIIQRNFDVEVINKEFDRSHPAHKHFRLYDDKSLIGRPKYMNSFRFSFFEDFEKQLHPEWKADGYVVVSKDPYSWYISYANWGKKHKWTDQEHSYIEEYNAYYNKWLHFANESDKVLLVRYIDLLADTDEMLHLIKNRFDLAHRGSRKGRKIKKVPYSSRFTRRRLNYYLSGGYIDEFEPEKMKELNESIDHDLIKKLGYKSYF